MALTSTIHPPDQLPAAFPVPPHKRNLGLPRADKQPQVSARPVTVDFAKTMIETNPMKSGRRALDVVVSLILHVVVIGIPVFLSLWYTNTIDVRAFTRTMLVGPPPPPPPPAAPTVAARAMAPKRVFFDKGKLLAPAFIPQKVVILKEAPLPEESDLAGVAGGVPGGVPGGQLGGVLGGILGGISKPPTPVAPKAKAPLRVGGRIRAPRAIFNPPPDYPPIALQARVQGTVIIRAIIDEHGNITDMQLVSGQPLLVKAALDAVAKWKYEPTYLNDEPVPVEMNITVLFQMH